ncbi:hypothetical protein DASC09_023930 [Saccharomycopsis crataegensis]|uniref:WD40 repeat-like protein n=1 Tax=Saccharomycopsis crataegensis TaxID=43959 RepID=A0AAV5QLL7_9ASCO|nr:hypothetical protein DASC09_023930 [Saccharomycopsis crataegensis]
MLNPGTGLFPYSGYYKEDIVASQTKKSSPHPQLDHNLSVASNSSGSSHFFSKESSTAPLPKVESIEHHYKYRTRDSRMFVPPKYLPTPSYLNPASTTCPVSHLDINSVGIINSESSLDFTNTDGTYKQTVFMIISRTPLSNDDPNTYIALPPDYQPNKSKVFANYNFALTSNSGTPGDDNTNGEKQSTPATDTGSNSGSSQSKSEVDEKLPFGSNLNPLLPDPFKFVHLTPGCNGLYLKIKSSDLKYEQINVDTSLESANKSKWGLKLGMSRSLQEAGGSTNSIIHNEYLKAPKTSIVRNSSTFLARALPVENFSKKLNSTEAAACNYHGKVFNLYSIRPNTSPKITHVREIVDDNPLMRMTFTSTISCVTWMLTGAGNNLKLDILIGFISGDIFWYDPFCNRYCRFNKQGKLLRNAPVMCLEWCSGGEYFIAGFGDGSVLRFARSKDDDDDHYLHMIQNRKQINKNSNKFIRILKPFSQNNSTSLNPVTHYKLSSLPITSISVFNNAAAPISYFQKQGANNLPPNASSNSLVTISHQKISNLNIKNLVSITCDDGFLRIFDIVNENLTEVIPSYFSSLTCSAWSFDGKYLATGGQDDLISIFEVSNIHQASYTSNTSNANSPVRSHWTGANNNTNSRSATATHLSPQFKLVARLEGHCSWIRSIKFDALKSPPSLIATPVNYRLGSVGDDGKFLLWDFSPRLLPKPQSAKLVNKQKYHHHHHHHNHAHNGSNARPGNRKRSNTAGSRKRDGGGIILPLNNADQPRSLAQALSTYAKATSSNANTKSPGSPSASPSVQTIIHDSVPKNAVPFVQPVVVVDCGIGRLSSLQFTDDGIWVIAAGGDIRKWDRPKN